METILNSIIARLAEMADLAYVAEDWGQLDDYGSEMPVKFPCALVDFVQAQWQNKGHRQQMGQAAITVTVAYKPLFQASAKASGRQLARGLQVHASEAEVYKALHGWNPSPECSKLIRTATRKIKKQDGTKVVEATYTFEVYTQLPTGRSTLAAPAIQTALAGGA